MEHYVFFFFTEEEADFFKKKLSKLQNVLPPGRPHSGVSLDEILPELELRLTVRKQRGDGKGEREDGGRNCLVGPQRRRAGFVSDDEDAPC